MFDPVTDEALRLRRRGAPAWEPGEPAQRTALVCAVCGREMNPEEEVFWVGHEPHCSQCHDMLSFELDKDREREAEAKERGTKWDKGP